MSNKGGLGKTGPAPLHWLANISLVESIDACLTEAEESLREGQLDAGDQAAFAKMVELPPSEPDTTAYEVDPAKDLYRRFTGAIEAGGAIELSLPTIDGRRGSPLAGTHDFRAVIFQPLKCGGSTRSRTGQPEDGARNHASRHYG
jgi:hypothetical protein